MFYALFQVLNHLIHHDPLFDFMGQAMQPMTIGTLTLNLKLMGVPWPDCWVGEDQIISSMRTTLGCLEQYRT